MKKITILTMGIILLTMGLAFAQQSADPGQSIAQPIVVGNKHCPVSGGEVGRMGAPITYEYNGKVYNLCCPGCIKSFKNNPEKYSKIAQDDIKLSNE